VDRWRQSSGQHAQQIHQVLVQRPRDLLQVQLDELRHKVQGAVLWIAVALVVSTRLWLGATVSQRRDTDRTVRLVRLVKASALCHPLLLCFDGLSTYITACRRVFRAPLRTGQRRRPRLAPWPDLYPGQIIKQYARRRVVATRRWRPGAPTAVGASWNCCPIVSLLFFSWKRQETATVKCGLTSKSCPTDICRSPCAQGKGEDEKRLLPPTIPYFKYFVNTVTVQAGLFESSDNVVYKKGFPRVWRTSGERRKRSRWRGRKASVP